MLMQHIGVVDMSLLMPVTFNNLVVVTVIRIAVDIAAKLKTFLFSQYFHPN